jgi:hypothetical protein
VLCNSKDGYKADDSETLKNSTLLGSC